MSYSAVKTFSDLNRKSVFNRFYDRFSVRSVKKLTISALALVVWFLASAGCLSAATFTVTTTADNESNGCGIGQCTLREAIEDANNSSGADTVNLNGVSGTITLTGGQLVITDNLTINAPGARNLSVNGNNASRVFLIATPLLGGNFTVNINGLTITGGNATPLLIGSTLIGDGGGILNGALLGVLSGVSRLNLNDSVVSGNRTTTLGGGVATRIGAVTVISRSLISANTCNPLTPVDDGTVGGGGISNAALSTTTVVNSTVTGNDSLAIAGGIVNVAGTVNLTNDTISHNTSTLAGGGVVSLLGTIPPILGVTNARNTIIAKNNDLLATNILGRDVVGVLGSYNSQGNNLIGSNFGAEANFTASVADSGGVLQPNPQVDLVGGIDVGNQIIDPLLSALANNGGQVDTRAISVSSPALNRGNNCVVSSTCGANPPSALLTDQRGAGFFRLSGLAVDVGSYEYQFGVTAAGVSLTGKVFDSRGKALARAMVTVDDGTGNVRSTMTNSFGNYRFDDLTAGKTFIVQAAARDYQFAPQIVSLRDDLTGLNFTAATSKINGKPGTRLDQ